VLATSREPLRVAGERAYAVPALRIEEATQLFAERAQAARPDFEVSEANAAVVEEICRKLDALPLAIELAAARTNLFPPAALLARVEERLKLLADEGPGRPDRHQTLRAAIDWSYQLLAALGGGCLHDSARSRAAGRSSPPKPCATAISM
jgi:predicted ATPase